MKQSQFIKELRTGILPHIKNFKVAFPWADEMKDQEFVDLCCKAEKARNQKKDIRCMWIANAHRETVRVYVEVKVNGSEFKILNSPFSFSFVYKHAAKAL